MEEGRKVAAILLELEFDFVFLEPPLKHGNRVLQVVVGIVVDNRFGLVGQPRLGRRGKGAGEETERQKFRSSADYQSAIQPTTSRRYVAVKPPHHSGGMNYGERSR